MAHHAPPHLCRICREPIEPCLIPIGAHLLCEDNAECRHEMCELLWGDPDDEYRLAICNHADARRDVS